jgi:predicted dehydrogenase
MPERDFQLDPLRIGVVGAGIIGQLAHIANFVQVPECTVVGLAELRPELGKLVARKYGIPNLYATHHELLEDGCVEALAVITRRPALGPVILDALAAGCHVLSEKPVAHSVEQAGCLVDARERAGRRLIVGYMKRHDAGVQAAKRLIADGLASGKFGRLESIHAHSRGGDFWAHCKDFVMTDEPRPEGLALWQTFPSWLAAAQRAAYADFTNVFIHDLNLLRFFSPGTLMVNDASFHGPMAGDVRLSHGDVQVRLSFSGSGQGAWNEGVDAKFEKRTIRIQLPSPMDQQGMAAVYLCSGNNQERVAPTPLDTGWSFRRQADAFVQAVAGNGHSIDEKHDLLEDIRLIEDIWRCIR